MHYNQKKKHTQEEENKPAMAFSYTAVRVLMETLHFYTMKNEKTWEKCIMKSFMILLFTKRYYCNQSKQD